MYKDYARIAVEKFKEYPETVPCIDPNFDHSPRSGGKGVIMHNSTPELWGELCKQTSELVSSRDGNDLMFVKAWNEWGEGNYLEPDLRFGTGYIDEMSKVLR